MAPGEDSLRVQPSPPVRSAASGPLQAVQVIEPRHREDLCIDAAAALEDRVGILTPIDPR